MDLMVSMLEHGYTAFDVNIRQVAQQVDAAVARAKQMPQEPKNHQTLRII